MDTEAVNAKARDLMAPVLGADQAEGLIGRVNAAEALLVQGAKDVTAYITHGVLSGGAVARITSSKLKELVITDSILPTEAVKIARNIRTMPIATLLGEAIGRTSREESVSSLFE